MYEKILHRMPLNVRLSKSLPFLFFLMSKSTLLLKPYLRKLILQTHPDFFHNDSVKKQVNASSLQKLQQALLNNENKKSYSLKFYPKTTKKPITAVLSADSEWIKAQSFFQLCDKLSIPVLPSDQDTVQSMILRQQQPQRKPLKKEFATKLYEEHSSEFQRELNVQDILNGLVMFEPNVNKNKMAQQLCQWLPELQPQRWWGKIPLLIVSKSIPAETAKGILCVTEDMQLQDIQSYINENLDSVIKEHKMNK
ncbi:hypothetical protein K501DRAFT_333906 [Backusella circina FSU 941]|nr:hypothetical protein K501DRAFT_333906 [Backusella circina FSU 941]